MLHVCVHAPPDKAGVGGGDDGQAASDGGGGEGGGDIGGTGGGADGQADTRLDSPAKKKLRLTESGGLTALVTAYVMVHWEVSR